MSIAVADLEIGRTRIRSLLAGLAERHGLTQPTAWRGVFPTGFELMDRALSGGIRPGELVVLGGKPGIGKTIAATQWARAMAGAGIVAIYVSYQHDELVLLTRLLSCELGSLLAAVPGDSAERSAELRARIADVAAGAISLRAAIESDPLLAEAHRRLAADADRLVLAAGSGVHTDTISITEIARRFAEHPVAVFVDYVQKVPASQPGATQQVGVVVEELKQLALERKVAVVAVAAADHAGLAAPRLRSTHLRGSTALTYEPDAIVMLNEAPAPDGDAVNRGGSVMFSIEKNRNGAADVDMEFAKDFSHFRFQPTGRRSTVAAARSVARADELLHTRFATAADRRPLLDAIEDEGRP